MKNSHYQVFLDHSEENSSHIDSNLLNQWLLALNGEVDNYRGSSSSISVKFVTTKSMIFLNSKFRGEEGPTNVLAFPSELEIHKESLGYLGDIALCLEVIKEEALKQKKSFDDHLIHIFLHGVLHLLGYDHQSEVSAIKMEKVEIRILNKLGIADPY